MTAEARVYRNALIWSLVTAGVIGVVGSVVGWMVAGGQGVVAALLGAAVGAVGGASTPLAMLVGHRKPPHVLGAIVAGAALGTFVIFFAAVMILRQIDGFPRGVFGVCAIAAVIGGVAIAFFQLRRARIPYVERGSESP